MANIKSAKKRVVIERERNKKNNSQKSRLKTEIKKLRTLIAENNVEEAEKQYNVVTSTLDSAVSKNLIHKNSADRKKAHYAKKIENLKSAKK